jgi:predicted transcriptional regulator
MAILKSPPKQPKAVTIQARVEESVKTQLELYAEFIDASPSYVITEALKLLFRKDDEFRRWADQHTNNHNNEKARGDVLERPSSKHETPSNPIRRAREYSVSRTACLAPRREFVMTRIGHRERKTPNPG